MTCTKPNCDCIQKEIEAQGTDQIKSYPCLAPEVESERQRLQDELSDDDHITSHLAADQYGRVDMPPVPKAHPENELNRLLHELWGDSKVGGAYNKKKWMDMQRCIEWLTGERDLLKKTLHQRDGQLHAVKTENMNLKIDNEVLRKSVEELTETLRYRL